MNNWDNQIGGNHYRTTEGEQHWDMIVRLFGLEAARGYLIGCATKYLLRAHIKEEGKNELKDIEKAIHYMNKWKSILEEESKKEYTKSKEPEEYKNPTITIPPVLKDKFVNTPTFIMLSNGTCLGEDTIYSYQYEEGSNIRTIFKVDKNYFKSLLMKFFQPDFKKIPFSCDFCSITLDKNNNITSIKKLNTFTTVTIKQLEAVNVQPASPAEIVAFEKAMKQ